MAPHDYGRYTPIDYKDPTNDAKDTPGNRKPWVDVWNRGPRDIQSVLSHFFNDPDGLTVDLVPYGFMRQEYSDEYYVRWDRLVATTTAILVEKLNRVCVPHLSSSTVVTEEQTQDQVPASANMNDANENKQTAALEYDVVSMHKDDEQTESDQIAAQQPGHVPWILAMRPKDVGEKTVDEETMDEKHHSEG